LAHFHFLYSTCPADAKASGWSCFNVSSKTCGTTGTKTKTRSAIALAAYGDFAAPALTQPYKVRIFNQTRCAEVENSFLNRKQRAGSKVDGKKTEAKHIC
jgi:hypothetical protein